MKDKIPQRNLLPFTERDIEIASKIVIRELGEDFDIEYGELPRNVGVIGDEGVRGDTAMITSDEEHPAESLTPELFDKLGRLATQICNETTVTKVLVDITPKDIVPTPLIEKEERQDKAIPFIDIVKRRIEGYPVLKRKYYDQLEGDPMLQTSVSATLDFLNLDLKTKVARQMAEELFKIGKKA